MKARNKTAVICGAVGVTGIWAFVAAKINASPGIHSTPGIWFFGLSFIAVLAALVGCLVWGIYSLLQRFIKASRPME